jgi:hypothetical protein
VARLIADHSSKAERRSRTPRGIAELLMVLLARRQPSGH